MKNVLFFGHTSMELYRAIVDEMRWRGWHVDIISEQYNRHDPDNAKPAYDFIRTALLVNRKRFERRSRQRWQTLLAQPEYNKKYDIFFVLNGMGLHPCVFDILRERNSQLQAVSYLYDSVAGEYRFDLNFPRFDRVYTFDRGDAKRYGIGFLPNSWTPIEPARTQYRFFALGTHNMPRLRLFRAIADIAKEDKKPSYIHLVVGKPIPFYRLRMAYRKLRGRPYVPLADYINELSTYDRVSASEFRRLINLSDIIVDNAAPWQDGLTPRFMWALATGKKIITDNLSADQYDFYTPEQIYILRTEPEQLANDQAFRHFLETPISLTAAQRAAIDRCRIDHWLDTIIN